MTQASSLEVNVIGHQTGSSFILGIRAVSVLEKALILYGIRVILVKLAGTPPWRQLRGK